MIEQPAVDPRFAPEPESRRRSPDWLRVIFGLVAAAQFAWAGLNMINLQTSGGNTIAELFDNYMGYFSFGMALLAAGWALSRPNR